MKRLLFFASVTIAFLRFPAAAQDEEFDMGAFQQVEGSKVFCNNKVNGLRPTKLLSISYDWMGGSNWESQAGEAFDGASAPGNNDFSNNHGIRLETNYPIISKNSIVVNAYLNYWESRYSVDGNAPEIGIGQVLGNTPLRSTTAGFLVFKPLDEKHFIIAQADASFNGNYNFSDINMDFSKAKISAALLYGWKMDDNTNFALGVTRTYRGGRVLHIPILFFNKAFNKKWGVEMLLPARAALRRNFSSKSIATLGYVLEGQSYHLQAGDGQASLSPLFGGSMDMGNDDWELRKSEIRARLSWDKAISDFVWFNIQAGAMVAYRMDVDLSASETDAWIENSPSVPFYFRFGIRLVSP